MKRDTVVRIPVSFHRILKLEALRHDKPMTKYMESLAKDIETRHGSIENYFKKSPERDRKKNKGFGLSF